MDFQATSEEHLGRAGMMGLEPVPDQDEASPDLATRRAQELDEHRRPSPVSEAGCSKPDRGERGSADCVTFVSVLSGTIGFHGSRAERRKARIHPIDNALADSDACSLKAAFAFNFQWAWSSGTVAGRSAAFA